MVANLAVVQLVSHRRQLFQRRRKASPSLQHRRELKMSLRGLRAWLGRGAAAEDDEDETMVRDPNV